MIEPNAIWLKLVLGWSQIWYHIVSKPAQGRSLGLDVPAMRHVVKTTGTEDQASAERFPFPLPIGQPTHVHAESNFLSVRGLS